MLGLIVWVAWWCRWRAGSTGAQVRRPCPHLPPALTCRPPPTCCPPTCCSHLTCHPFRWRRPMTGCATGTPGRRRGRSTCCPCTSTGAWSTAPKACAGWTRRYHRHFLGLGAEHRDPRLTSCRGLPLGLPCGSCLPTYLVGMVQTPTVKLPLQFNRSHVSGCFVVRRLVLGGAGHCGGVGVG